MIHHTCLTLKSLVLSGGCPPWLTTQLTLNTAVLRRITKSTVSSLTHMSLEEKEFPLADLNTKFSSVRLLTMGPDSFVFTHIFTEKCPRQRYMPPPQNGSMPLSGNPGSAPVFHMAIPFKICYLL